MATVDELNVKLHVMLLGYDELEHLIAMLKANLDCLPVVVVKAMQALADSLPADKEDAANV